MLIVRPTAYVVPVAEQDFASLTPTVTIVNSGTVSAIITGHVHIYRESTGLKLYTSELRITTIGAGASADVSALTPWSPPAPADDDYFIMCDVTAIAIEPHQPPGDVEILGPYTFDIKPVGMGPAPAAHGVTHEDGGSDELDVTDLEGLLADPQTPLPHAATHETGGSDEIDVTDLAGLLADAQTPLPHAATHADGGGDDVDHNTLDNLTTGDPHTQYRLRHEIYFATEFTHLVIGATQLSTPWLIAAISGGAVNTIEGTPSHPGIIRFSSGAAIGTGHRLIISSLPILIAGHETSLCWHRPQVLANTTRHHGFHDTTTAADPVDGAWIWQNPATGIIYGRTMSNSVGSTTGTGYQLVTNTWYCEKIVVNADASQVDFYCYDEAGNELWHDSLTTNIPTAAGRELGHGVVATSSGGVAMDDLDFLSISIPDRRPVL